MVITILLSMSGQQEQHIVITLCMLVAVLVVARDHTVILYIPYLVGMDTASTDIPMLDNINPAVETLVYTMVGSMATSIGIAAEPLREWPEDEYDSEAGFK